VSVTLARGSDPAEARPAGSVPVVSALVLPLSVVSALVVSVSVWAGGVPVLSGGVGSVASVPSPDGVLRVGTPLPLCRRGSVFSLLRLFSEIT